MEPALDSDSETHMKKIGPVEQIRGKTQNGPPCKCTCYFSFGELNYNIFNLEWWGSKPDVWEVASRA